MDNVVAPGLLSPEAFYRHVGDLTERLTPPTGPIGYYHGKAINPITGASEKLYMLANSSLATVAAPVVQPTGTAIRTMLQIQAPSTKSLTVVEWGISLDGTVSTNPPGKCELLSTTVAATMSTASVLADVTSYNGPADEGTLITFGATTNTGFATAAVTEGTIANYRLGDLQQIPPTSGWVKQWPLGREFVVPLSKYLRVRVTFSVTVNAYIYVVWSE